MGKCSKQNAATLHITERFILISKAVPATNVALHQEVC